MVELAAKLDIAIREVVQELIGVSIGRKDDPATWEAQLPEDMPKKARSAAEKKIAAIVASFNPALPSLSEFGNSIQAVLDSGARDAGYDDIASMVSYVGDPNEKFAAEGEAARDWRSAVWTYATEQLSLIEKGEREFPTLEQFAKELPAMSAYLKK